LCHPLTFCIARRCTLMFFSRPASSFFPVVPLSCTHLFGSLRTRVVVEDPRPLACPGSDAYIALEPPVRGLPFYSAAARLFLPLRFPFVSLRIVTFPSLDFPSCRFHSTFFVSWLSTDEAVFPFRAFPNNFLWRPLFPMRCAPPFFGFPDPADSGFSRGFC